MFLVSPLATGPTQTPPCNFPLDQYSNLLIAIFTIAAVTIAALELREAVRGPDVTLYLADRAAVFIGPASLSDAERAIFFTIALVFVNEGPKTGTAFQVRLEMLAPDPNLKVKRASGEEDWNRFVFRFEKEEATGGPIPALSLEGNSSRMIRAQCAIIKTNIIPGDSHPPTADLMSGRVKLRIRYSEVQKKEFVDKSEEKEFPLSPAWYDDAVVRSRREFLGV